MFSRRQWSSVAACWEAHPSRRDEYGRQLLATGTGLARDVATKTRKTRAPWYARTTEGKTQLPMPSVDGCRALSVPRTNSLTWCARYCTWVEPTCGQKLYEERWHNHFN